MAGNVWEWTAEPFQIRSAVAHCDGAQRPCAAGGREADEGRRFLCHISYCYRYRIAARLAVAADSGGCNSGLRVFYDL